MRSVTRALPVASLLAALAVAAAGVAQGTSGLQPPVVEEQFSALPCPKDPAARQTTLGLQGCLGQRILKTDATINARVRAIFSKLHDDTGRRKLIAAERAWLSYRELGCRSVADVYRGGSLQPVAYLECVAGRNDVHVGDLAAFLETLKRR